MEYVRFGDLYMTPSFNGLSRPSAVRGKGFRMIGMGELFAHSIIHDMNMERVFMNTKEQDNFFVEDGDLLFARQSLVASGAGKCSIVSTLSEKTTFESHLIRVRLDKSKCNPLYYKDRIMVVDWYKDAQPRQRVLSLIQTSLNKDLPESYDRAVFNDKTNMLFNHFVDMAAQGYGWIA